MSFLTANVNRATPDHNSIHDQLTKNQVELYYTVRESANKNNIALSGVNFLPF